MRELHCNNYDENHACPAEECSKVDDNFGIASIEGIANSRSYAVKLITCVTHCRQTKFETAYFQMWLTIWTAVSTSAMSLPALCNAME